MLYRNHNFIADFGFRCRLSLSQMSSGWRETANRLTLSPECGDACKLLWSPEIVDQALKPMYERFDFFPLPATLTAEEIAQWRHYSF